MLRNAHNLGVGGAVIHGYRQAKQDGFDIAVKIDGDGQMDPALLPKFVADLDKRRITKGNRL